MPEDLAREVDVTLDDIIFLVTDGEGKAFSDQGRAFKCIAEEIIKIKNFLVIE